jgi:membrane-bound lytic murein transglycosylase F
MQLTRRTAKSLGVKNIYNPRENIYAGVRHLKDLYVLFDQAEGVDRIFIALGAYNVGQGHMRDAQRLAIHLDLSPTKWSALSKTLTLLSKRKYYKNAKYGYCRGGQAVQYVRQIMIYYDILKHQGSDFGLRPTPPSKSVQGLPRL